MLISVPYLRAGLRHYTFSIFFCISYPFIIYSLSITMKLSIVLFLRALLFFVLATSLEAVRMKPQVRAIAEDKEYLTQHTGHWTREEAPGDVGRSFVIFLIYTYVDPQVFVSLCAFLNYAHVDLTNLIVANRD